MKLFLLMLTCLTFIFSPCLFLESQEWGVVPHIDGEEIISEAHVGGVQWLRIPAPWNYIEPDENGPRDWARTDETVLQAKRRGMAVYMDICGVPRWASMSPSSPYWDRFPVHGAKLARWKQFVHDVIERYTKPGFGVKHFDTLNEPNSCGLPRGDSVKFFYGNREDYLKLYLDVLAEKINYFRTVRKIECYLCAGELADGSPGDGNKWPNESQGYTAESWIKGILERLKNKHNMRLDVLTVHRYDNIHGPGNIFDELDRWWEKTIVPTCTSLRISPPEVWLSETNWLSSRETDYGKARRRAEEVYRKMTDPKRKNWLKKIFPFVLNHTEKKKYWWTAYKRHTIPGPDRRPMLLDLDAEPLADYREETLCPKQMVKGWQHILSLTMKNLGGKTWQKETNDGIEIDYILRVPNALTDFYSHGNLNRGEKIGRNEKKNFRFLFHVPGINPNLNRIFPFTLSEVPRMQKTHVWDFGRHPGKPRVYREPRDLELFPFMYRWKRIEERGNKNPVPFNVRFYSDYSFIAMLHQPYRLLSTGKVLKIGREGANAYIDLWNRVTGGVNQTERWYYKLEDGGRKLRLTKPGDGYWQLFERFEHPTYQTLLDSKLMYHWKRTKSIIEHPNGTKSVNSNEPHFLAQFDLDGSIIMYHPDPPFLEMFRGEADRITITKNDNLSTEGVLVSVNHNMSVENIKSTFTINNRTNILILRTALGNGDMLVQDFKRVGFRPFY